MKGLAVKERNIGPKELEKMIQFYDDLKEIGEPEKDHVVLRVLTASMAIDEVRAAEGTFMGYYSSQPKKVSAKTPLVPGMECCGEIVRVGPLSSANVNAEFRVGDIVLAHPTTALSKKPGSWCEYVSMPAQHLIKKPENFSPEEAVAVHVSGQTAVAALDPARARLDQVDTPKVVVVGATGSIGTLCMQIIRHKWPKSQVIAICSSRTASVAMDNGATQVIEYDQTPNWGAAIGHHEVDAVIDLVGGLDVEKIAGPCMVKGSFFVSMVGPEKYLGDKKKSLLGFIGFMMKASNRMMISRFFKPYTYTINDQSKADKSFYQSILDANVLKPTIQQIVPFDNIDEVKKAIRLVQSHRAKGKIILKVSDF